MTWKEFKESIEEQGVTDDMKLEYIDYQEDIPNNKPEVSIDYEDNTFSVY